VRAARASEQVAVRTVVVYAVDENASSFYGRFGFRALSTTPPNTDGHSRRATRSRLLVLAGDLCLNRPMPYQPMRAMCGALS
jgi:hypothetical protein